MALQKPVNFNDLDDAAQTIKTLEHICQELPNRREDAEKLTDTSVTTRSIRSGIEKITSSVPKRLRVLKERLEKISLFRFDLLAAEEFCRETEAVLEDAKSKTDEAVKQVCLLSSRQRRTIWMSQGNANQNVNILLVLPWFQLTLVCIKSYSNRYSKPKEPIAKWFEGVCPFFKDDKKNYLKSHY